MFGGLKKTNPRILVIGDLMIDSYLWGDCNRISPEAPVQIININNKNQVLGGAGNVVNNLVSLGAKVSILSVIGDCENSLELKKLLHDINISSEFLIEQKNRVTSKKTRIISSHQQVIRYDQESSDEISKESEANLYSIFEKIISEFELVLISDYGKGVLTNSLTQKIINKANSVDIKVIVDPKGKNYSKYRNAYFLTPNKKEASEATEIIINSADSLNKALKKIKKDCNLSLSIITMSEEGIAVYDSSSRVHPTVAKEVFDVTGAGDTVIASLAFAIVNNFDIDSSIKFANIAAGIVVAKLGSATTSIDEIMNFGIDSTSDSCASSIKSFDEIKNIVTNLKLSGKKIVFTNGCFDIAHIGHIKYLEEAKKQGDILIVGVNSDESVRRLKGNSRPINKLNDRACLIAALKSVDLVVPFNDDTPLEIIQFIRPDVLVKGGDYFGKNVVGQDIAKKLVLIDFVQGKSTSKIIEKIQKK